MGGSGFLSKIIKGETALTDSKTIASDFNTFIANIRNNLQSWTKLLRKFRKNTIKLLTIIFTRLCEPPFPHSMLYILTSHYMRTKSNIVQGEGGVIVNKRHKFILIEPKLYMSVNFLNRFCPRLSGFQCLLCVIF